MLAREIRESGKVDCESDLAGNKGWGEGKAISTWRPGYYIHETHK